MTTNLIFELNDDETTACCRSYFTVLQSTATLPLQAILTGRYHDIFEKSEGRWQFVSRHMIWDIPGDISQHMLQDPLAEPDAGEE